MPAHSPLLLRHSSLPFARLQTPKTPKTPQTLQFLRGSFHQAWPSAFAASGLQPALCLHIPRGSFHQAPGRQRSSIAACPLPAHSPLLLGPSSLPFARLQTPKMPKTLLCLHIALSCYGIRACRLPGFKPLKPLKLRGSFHQAWPSAFAAPGLQPALCLHIPRGSFHQAPGRQRSSIAACPLPAHSPLLLGPSSYLSIYLSIYLFVYPTVYLSICLSLSLSLSLYLSIHPSIHPSIYLSPSLCRTPQIGGVGGTRALAHSITG